ncbi:MAG: putative membrane protein YgcG [Verrucomicrobiales bacterium]|jgi:uncharacterized membrane protein YgcG
MKRTFAALALVLFGMSLAHAADEPVRLQRATDIVEKWSPGQHLYIRGNLNVSASQLAELERWLDANGKNWIVLLVEHARLEKAQSAGRSYSGVEAVETAANVKIRNETEFGNLKDARTGETNGAVFILFLQEREFSYGGGAVHEVRGLSGDDWAGDLDRPAYRAMSRGGRIVEAVKGTVTEVDRRLTRQFELDQQRRQAEIAAAKQLEADAQRLYGEASSALDRLEAKVADFPVKDGDLGSPDFAGLRQQLLNSQTRLKNGDAKAAVRDAAVVRDFCRAHTTALQLYGEFAERSRRIEAELEGLDRAESPWATERIDLAYDQLAKATAEHARGNSAYEAHLRSSAEAIATAKTAIRQAKEAARAAIVHRDRLRMEQERRARVLKWAFFWIGILVLLALIVIAILMNRARRDLKKRAIELYRNWKLGAEEQTNGLFELLDRSSIVVGSAAKLEERGYTGETLKISREVIEDVDELFIMSSCVERVLTQVYELVFPGFGFARLANLFLQSRYREAIHLLEREPIRFRPEDGIEPIIREELGEKERPLGSVDVHKPFELSFLDLIAACNQHADRAKAGLDTVEFSWAGIANQLEELSENFAKALSHEPALQKLAEQDGFLRLTPVFAALLPAVRALLDEAQTQAVGDPVGAMRGPMMIARRQLDDASGLATVVLDAREERFDGMRAATAELRQLSRKTDWVLGAIGEISDQADAVALAAVERDIEADIAEIETELRQLDHRISDAVRLAKRARETSAELIKSSVKAVAGARRSFGSGLKLKPTMILRELGLDPDEWIGEAKRQHAAAEVALDRGGVLAADAALGAVDELTTNVSSLIEASRSSYDNHAKFSDERGVEDEEVVGLAGERSELLDSLQSRYLGSALWFDREDETSTIADNVDHARNDLREARDLVEAAHDERKSAGLLAAAANLEMAADLQLRARQLLEEIVDHAARLQKVGDENRRALIGLGDRVKSMRSSVEDRRTLHPTIASFNDAESGLKSIGESNKAEVLDPFVIADQLADMTKILDSLMDRVKADWRLHDEFVRSLESAKSQLAWANDQRRLTATDNIPDSREIVSLNDEVGLLDRDLKKLVAEGNQAHQDWQALDSEADRIAAAAGRAATALRGELEKAQATIRAISLATALSREAAAWTGSYGVRISGRPGLQPLDQARELLLGGRYLQARRFAESAGGLAQQAIAAAVAEVARRRRAEEARLAEQRRKAAARRRKRMSTFSSSSTSFGGSRSGGFGSSSSSMGRSSHGGGSGMGRSGW